MESILITGAAGKIGDALRKGLRGSYPLIRLLDIVPLGTAETGEDIVAADIRDIVALETAMAGIDCVVHLAGASAEAPWETVLPLNIEGCSCHCSFSVSMRRCLASTNTKKSPTTKWTDSTRIHSSIYGAPLFRNLIEHMSSRYSHPRSPNAERSTPGGAYHPAEP